MATITIMHLINQILYPWKIGVKQIKTTQLKTMLQKFIFYPTAKNRYPTMGSTCYKVFWFLLQPFVIYLSGFDLFNTSYFIKSAEQILSTVADLPTLPLWRRVSLYRGTIYWSPNSKPNSSGRLFYKHIFSKIFFPLTCIEPLNLHLPFKIKLLGKALPISYLDGSQVCCWDLFHSRTYFTLFILIFSNTTCKQKTNAQVATEFLYLYYYLFLSLDSFS